MTVKKLKPADWEKLMNRLICNAADNPLFKSVSLNWSQPTRWMKTMVRPDCSEADPFVYALVRNHGNYLAKDHIVYIGLTSKPKSRFGNHETAKSNCKYKW